MNDQYLYGASVQGIQRYIFETNKLVEIAGASEIVEHICTDMLPRHLSPFSPDRLLIGAAGNIRYLFPDRSSCEAFAHTFPFEVMNIAPGITISQAATRVGQQLERLHISTLDAQLEKQRNQPKSPHGLGMMVTERSRRTGKAGTLWNRADVLDSDQQEKVNFTKKHITTLLHKLAGKIDQKYYPLEMSDITGNRENAWIAVIHADGNGLGKKIQEMKDSRKLENAQGAFRTLSHNLNAATIAAAATAYQTAILPSTQEGEKLPIRPVLLGGDDLTLIVRGDLAIEFTHVFLAAFERETQSAFKAFEQQFGIPTFSSGLTACAGIAFIKPNYPFHYGVRLADELCKYAKKQARQFAADGGLTPSCLSFHKVHSSFVEDYETIIEQEYRAGDTHLNYGPYFLKQQGTYASIEQLIKWSRTLAEKDAPKGQIRSWLTELSLNPQRAAQLLNRITSITTDHYAMELGLTDPFTDRSHASDESHSTTHLFEVMSLANLS